MIKPIILTASLLSISAIPAFVAAEETPLDRFGMSFSLDLMMGGEELAAIEFDDGSEESVKAGSGIGFGAGVSYQVDDHIKAEARMSYLSDSASGDTPTGSTITYDFTRYPVDVMGFYQHGKHSIGAGMTYHMSPTLSGEGDSYDFDSALGTILEYRFFYSNKATINLKMVNIDYDYKTVSFDGNSFGIGIAGHF